MSLPFFDLANTDPAKLNLVMPALNRFIPYTAIENQSPLAAILVVSADQYETVINDLIDRYSKIEAKYVVIERPSVGVAVPIESDAGLICFVILLNTLIQQASADVELTPGVDIISTVLEEFLHVRHYALKWRRRGYVQIPEKTAHADVLKLCEKCHDEYTINRWKLTVPVDQNEQGDQIGLAVVYGQSLAARIDWAMEELEKVVRLVRTQQLETGFAWTRTLELVQYGIFDPLSRDAAFRTERPNLEHIFSDAQRSRWYARHVEPYWQSFEASLSSTFDHEQTNAEAEFEAMAIQIRAFLAHIGITYKVIDDNISSAYFSTDFFDYEISS